MAAQVVVGLSGGVDSAVSAWLLKEQGYEVIGLFMQNWSEDESGYCTAAQDFQDARAVADELGIALHKVDFSAEYRSRVFEAFLAQLRRGLTPNPDVLCNREIKFQPFVEHARRLGADFVATGHYARTDEHDGAPRLLRAKDDNKDQTYFLAGVARQHFDRVIFPLGGLTKPEVRALATRAGLPNHQKKDSTGICFIGERPFTAFLDEHLPPAPGAIVDDTGRMLGSHNGLHHYTLGQRKGIGIGGTKGGTESPWYVVAKRAQRRELVISQNGQHPLLMQQEVRTHAFHWITPPSSADAVLTGRIRHRQALSPCQLVSSSASGATVRFAHAQRAVTPGQYVVLYEGEVCLGSGEIAPTDAAT